MVETQPTEQERKAIALQDNLKKFAAADFEARETMLLDLLQMIKTDASRETLDILPNSHSMDESLTQAVIKTQKTAWKMVSGDEVLPYGKGYTLIAVKNDGTIIGLIFQPTEEYGSPDLTVPALLKAVGVLHLNKAVGEGFNEFSGGLSTLENVAYLNKRGFGKHDGATANPALVDNQYVFLATSGCKATEKYLDPIVDEGGKSGLYTLAGEMDRVFADTTKMYLVNPKKKVEPILEPRLARETKLVRN